jgi:cytochrome P450
VTVPPRYQFDPYQPDVQRNPYDLYRQLREIAPVVHSVIDGRDVYAVAHDRNVRRVLTDWRGFTSHGGSTSLHPREDRMQAGALVSSDPEEDEPGVANHTHLVKLVAPYMSRRAMDELRAEVCPYIAVVVDEAVDAGTFDATALGRLIPTEVVSNLVGLPKDGRDRYADWAAAATSRQGPSSVLTPELLEQLQATQRYVAGLGQEGRLDPQGIGAKAFAAAADPRSPVSVADATSITWGAFIVAGMHTTIMAMTFMFEYLASYPEEWKLYRGWHAAGDAGRSRWIDELLRREVVFPYDYRTATRDVDVEGYTIPAGARVLALLGSANRDPQRWPDPDRFWPDRSDVDSHVGFGHGVHKCLGQYLARLELGAVLDRLCERGVERVQVGESAQWASNAAVRGWARLPISAVVEGDPPKP